MVDVNVKVPALEKLSEFSHIAARAGLAASCQEGLRLEATP